MFITVMHDRHKELTELLVIVTDDNRLTQNIFGLIYFEISILT